MSTLSPEKKRLADGSPDVSLDADQFVLGSPPKKPSKDLDGVKLKHEVIDLTGEDSDEEKPQTGEDVKPPPAEDAFVMRTAREVSQSFAIIVHDVEYQQKAEALKFFQQYNEDRERMLAVQDEANRSAGIRQERVEALERQHRDDVCALQAQTAQEQQSLLAEYSKREVLRAAENAELVKKKDLELKAALTLFPASPKKSSRIMYLAVRDGAEDLSTLSCMESKFQRHRSRFHLLRGLISPKYLSYEGIPHPPVKDTRGVRWLVATVETLLPIGEEAEALEGVIIPDLIMEAAHDDYRDTEGKGEVPLATHPEVATMGADLRSTSRIRQ
ncbi:hypothetical protein DYB32_009630 [Aphanomyces invadans]|uniref:Uncharacterized protein n=1 Tax=Aphanomyces invadans TaxID=157072 RepID=A0A418AHW0_9STRA|nr:hypothetical protein DYB32_009630 [Aphanomyces invadans]